MRVPRPYDWVLWGAVLLVLTIIISFRFRNYLDGTATPVDLALLVIWLAVLLSPLFSEVSIFGVRLKQQIESLGADLKERILNLRAEVQNAVSVTSEVSPRFYLGAPLDDDQLERLSDQIGEELRAHLADSGLQEPTVSEDIGVPDDVQYLLSIRYVMERELRRLWESQLAGELPGRGPRPLAHVLQSLIQTGLVESRLGDAILQIHRVTSAAVHGAEVTPGQIDFVRSVGPGLIASLRALE